MASFSFLESRAIFTVLSFLTAITTGLMNSSSEHLSSFMICFSSMSFCNSCSTLSSKCTGTRLPLCWDGLYCVLKIDFAMWFLERPNLVHSCGYLLNIHFMMFFSVWIFEINLTVLPARFLVCAECDTQFCKDVSPHYVFCSVFCY